MERSGNFLPPYISTRPLVLALTVALLTLAGLSALSAGFEISEIRLIGKLLDDQTITLEQRWAHGWIRISLVAARAAVITSVVILFVAWLFRSRVNARAFGARRFRFGRYWTITAFLIPGINLVRPLQIIKEVWQASNPRVDSSPLDWKAVRVPEFVDRWWWMLIGCIALEIIGVALTTSTGATLERVRVARAVTALADIATAINLAMAYMVVAGISDAQEAKWALLSGERGEDTFLLPEPEATGAGVVHEPAGAH